MQFSLYNRIYQGKISSKSVYIMFMYPKRWIGFGPGTSMDRGDIVLGWPNSTGGYTLSDRYTSGFKIPTLDVSQDVFPAPLLVTPEKWSVLAFSYRRSIIAVNASEDLPITIGTNISYIFATASFGPYTGVDFIDSTVGAHLSTSSGMFSFNFFPSNETLIDLGNLPPPGTEKSLGKLWPVKSDNATKVNQNNTIAGIGLVAVDFSYQTTILIHGWLMFASWSVSSVIGIFFAKFLKSLGKKWFYSHVGFMSFTVIATIGSFVYIFLNSAGDHFSDPHKVIGLIILISILLQAISGVTSHLWWNPQRLSIPWWDFLHWNFGRALVLLSFAETALGIIKFLPNDKLWISLYLAYIFVILLVYGIIMLLQRFKKNMRNIIEDTETEETENFQKGEKIDEELVNSNNESKHLSIEPRSIDFGNSKIIRKINEESLLIPENDSNNQS
ncbi:S-methyl-5-thioribose-1-phosphate isomerase [Nowakowskiella sp. JEL0078]|nr:S-methyl-5-thioribose-1-phosphate isomerase [Nowakowskiella sp. JEL0078]